MEINYEDNIQQGDKRQEFIPGIIHLKLGTQNLELNANVALQQSKHISVRNDQFVLEKSKPTRYMAVFNMRKKRVVNGIRKNFIDK